MAVAYNAFSGVWRRLPYPSISRYLGSMTSINGTQLVICGGAHFAANNWKLLSSCERLIDPINNSSATWVQDIPDLPVQVYSHSIAYLGNELFLFGGIHNTLEGVELSDEVFPLKNRFYDRT